MKKNAQLTLMIIIGIIILFALGLIIWLGTQAATRKTAPEAGQQRLRQVAVQPVKDYIQSCLDVTTSTALELLGRQGGVLYRHQGGLTPNVQPQDKGSRFIEYDGLNVSYVILRPTQDIGPLSIAQPPNYPYRTFPYLFKNDDEKTGEVVRRRTEGYFGDYQLAPLYKPGKDSIQEQLESFINVTLPRCTDWQTFQPQGLSIVAGEPSATVLIAENLTQIETEQAFTVVVDWQVNITDLATGGATSLERFSLSYPVHLAKFYHFVQQLVSDEISNSTFDPRSVSTPATPIEVMKDVYQNPVDQSTDDLIVVRDTASFLRGKPLEFRILRKDRIPALVWINQTDLDKHRFIASIGYCEALESIFFSGSELVIKNALEPAGVSQWQATVTAIDPDEDNVTFTTEPQTPAKLSVDFAGQDFNLYVRVSDGGAVTDFQILKVHTGDCPPP